MPHSYSIIGSGALGAYYGGLLARSGKQVHFLVRTEVEAEYMRQHGLQVDSPKGDFHLSGVSVSAHPDKLPRSEVVVVALKSTQNALFPTLLPRVTAANATVLCLQNGLGNEECLRAALPTNPIVGGLCFLCSHKVGPGHVQHLDYGPVRFADYREDRQAAPPTPIAQEIAADFRAAGVSSSLAEDLFLARWMKLVWNIPFNGLCALTGWPTDRVLADEPLRQLALELMGEVRAAASAWGKELPEGVAERMVQDTLKMASYRPSMQVDAELGRPLEWEFLYARPAVAAREKGVEAPRIHALLALLRQLDQKRAAAENLLA
jgi:2-dehydropantoate 2-reductase